MGAEYRVCEHDPDADYGLDEPWDESYYDDLEAALAYAGRWATLCPASIFWVDVREVSPWRSL